MNKLLMKNSFFGFFLIFLFVFIFSFLYTAFIIPICGDEIWVYGFCHNIVEGMIIYRDFNVIVTPFYFFVGSFFIRMFGDYLVSLHVFDCILISFLMILLVKRMGLYRAMLMYPVILFNFFPTYSYFCLFLLFIILYLLDRKDFVDDNVISFLCGFIFITKQSIGIFLLFPILFFSRNKIKSLFIYFIPFVFVLIYLILNQAFFDFVDYCFLGLFDFNRSNFEISIFFVLEIIVCIYLVYHLKKSSFQDKRLWFILAFQVNCYPIFDVQHFIMVFIPFLYYFLLNFNFYKLRLYYRWLLMIVVYAVFFIYIFDTVFYFDYAVSFDRNDFLYLRNNSNIALSIRKKSKFIYEYSSSYDSAFLLCNNNYAIKLYNHMEIGKYDLLMDGNLGYHGDVRIIREIDNLCEKKRCVFFVDKRNFEKFDQFNRDIYDYVLNNYSCSLQRNDFYICDNHQNT